MAQPASTGSLSKPSDDVAVKVSADAAEMLVSRFYTALDSTQQRGGLASYFLAESDLGDGVKLPFINFNGEEFSSGEAFQAFFEAQPRTSFTVQSLDAQVINPALPVEGRSDADAAKGRNMSVMVMASGVVKVGPRDAVPAPEDRGFSDTFILVPNPKAATAGRRDRGQKDWLLQSYNARLVT